LKTHFAPRENIGGSIIYWVSKMKLPEVLYLLRSHDIEDVYCCCLRREAKTKQKDNLN
tara:strand:- start:207 stop:380 length:174 start_codon:yes stop_codon:yes gene_type:complete